MLDVEVSAPCLKRSKRSKWSKPSTQTYLCCRCWARFPESALVVVAAKVGREFRCRACVEKGKDDE